MSTSRIDRRVALALGRGEARRILRSVALLLFLPISVWALLTAVNGHTRWPGASISAAVGLVPLAWCLLVLTNLGWLRDRRHDVDTITDTAPSAHTTRTAGHLLGGLVGVPVGAALLLIFALIKRSQGDLRGSPDLLELAVPLLIVAGAAVVGVAVARWLPWALFSVPAIIATMAITGLLGGTRTGRTRFLGFIADETSQLPGLDVRPRVLHLVWLLAWIGIVAVVALGRNSRGPRVWGTAALLFVVAIAAGLGQMRDIDAETAADRADLLNDPIAHQKCDLVHDVIYCAYPDADENMNLWQDTVAAVQVHLPASVNREGLTVSQRVPWISGNTNCGPSMTLELMDESISRHVSVRDAWSRDGDVHPGIAIEAGPCGGTDFEGLYTAVQVGAWSVGLPPAQWDAGETCAADGQARSAIALWLGAAGGAKLAAYVDELFIGADGRVDLYDWDDPPTWGVDWHPTDLAAAVAIAGLPTSRVDEVVAAHWAELVDSTTSTDRLLALLDLSAADTAIAAPADTCPSVRRT